MKNTPLKYKIIAVLIIAIFYGLVFWSWHSRYEDQIREENMSKIKNEQLKSN